TSDHDPAMRWIVGGKAAQRSAITRHLGQTEYAVEFAISQQPLLRGLITPVRVGIRAIHARDNVPLPPITALDDKDQQKLLDASDVLRFTIVRNPYSRLVSTWRTKVFLRDPDTVDVYSELQAEAPALGQKNLVNFDEFVSYIEGTAGRIWDLHWQRQVDLT